MSTEQLKIYLEQLRVESLPPSIEEVNEPLMTAYGIVEWTIRDQCTVIEISPQRVIWKKEIGGETIGEFPTPISFKPFFQLIANRDPMIQVHLRLIQHTEREVKYQIV